MKTKKFDIMIPIDFGDNFVENVKTIIYSVTKQIRVKSY